MIWLLRVLLVGTALCRLSLAAHDGHSPDLPREYTEIVLAVEGMV